MSYHRNCPTCTCTTIRRLTITPQLLDAVACAYAMGGVERVAQVFDRSRSQAYRLVARAQEAGRWGKAEGEHEAWCREHLDPRHGESTHDLHCGGR